MIDLFWEVHQTGRINEANRNAADASQSVGRAERGVNELEDRIDKLSMICCAMWTIIQAHTDVPDQKLIDLVQELDLSDGVLDGRVRLAAVQNCSSCDRPVATRHLRCIYCGAEQTPKTPFDAVL